LYFLKKFLVKPPNSTLPPAKKKNLSSQILNYEIDLQPTVAMQNGMLFLQCAQFSSVSGTGPSQYGHGEFSSSSSLAADSFEPGLRTTASIFLEYLGSTCERYSGRISMAA
jgi:hypothetical protein